MEKFRISEIMNEDILIILLISIILFFTAAIIAIEVFLFLILRALKNNSNKTLPGDQKSIAKTKFDLEPIAKNEPLNADRNNEAPTNTAEKSSYLLLKKDASFDDTYEYIDETKITLPVVPITPKINPQEETDFGNHYMPMFGNKSQQNPCTQCACKMSRKDTQLLMSEKL